MARVSCGLRLCSLDRACGEEVADTVGTTALTQALAAALRLPSRFPRCGASLSWPADGHHFGAYVQAAKVGTGFGRAYGRTICRREDVFWADFKDLGVGGRAIHCRVLEALNTRFQVQRVPRGIQNLPVVFYTRCCVSLRLGEHS